MDYRRYRMAKPHQAANFIGAKSVWDKLMRVQLWKQPTKQIYICLMIFD